MVRPGGKGFYTKVLPSQTKNCRQGIPLRIVAPSLGFVGKCLGTQEGCEAFAAFGALEAFARQLVHRRAPGTHRIRQWLLRRCNRRRPIAPLSPRQ